MAGYETLQWDQDEGMATITLDRPEKKNAMSWAMFTELGDAFAQGASDPAVRCIVVTGAGDAFCSGADLTDPANMATGAVAVRDRMKAVNRIARAVITCPKPTIARVTGVAAGAGCNLALGCDLVIATPEARFAELFVKQGLVVDFGGTWALTRLLPLNKAKELAMLGDEISGARAFELGLVNRLCDPGEVDACVKDFASRLCALPPGALAMIKENLNRAAESSLDSVLENEGASQALSLMSEDTREAVLAWVEKREPRFTGR